MHDGKSVHPSVLFLKKEPCSSFREKRNERAERFGKDILSKRRNAFIQENEKIPSDISEMDKNSKRLIWNLYSLWKNLKPS